MKYLTSKPWWVYKKMSVVQRVTKQEPKKTPTDRS